MQGGGSRTPLNLALPYEEMTYAISVSVKEIDITLVSHELSPDRKDYIYMTYFLHNINSKIKHTTWYCSSDIFDFDEGLEKLF